MGRRLKDLDDWSVEESFDAAKRLKKLLPDLQMDTCARCKCWMVVLDGWTRHPSCAAVTKPPRHLPPETGQDTLGI